VERAIRDVGGFSAITPAYGAPRSGDHTAITTRTIGGVIRAFGPGRVNLIGEHTDYNGGLALPFAIDRGITVEAEPRDGGGIVVTARDAGEEDAFDVADPGRAQGWRAFVRGTVAELRASGVDVPGARLAFGGDVPQGSGLSSSAALEAALCLALLALAGAGEPDRVELAKLCSRVENDWVGAETGLLDQLASLCSSSGAALRIDFATLELAPVPLDLGDWQLVTQESGAEHTHAAGGYNERRAECRAVCDALGIPHVSAADPEAAAALPDPLARRARHVLSENARVDAMVAALRAGDLARVGTLLDASHASLRDDYAASVPEVEATVAALKDAGAAGARMVGGGFGGSVLALLPPGVAVPGAARLVAPGPPAGLL
jgi:galactokinase